MFNDGTRPCATKSVPRGVLKSLARALQLDSAERAHPFNPARATDGTSALGRPRRFARSWKMRPSLQWVLDAVTAGPAFVRNGRLDLLAASSLRPHLLRRGLRQPTGPAEPGLLCVLGLGVSSLLSAL